VRTDEPGSRAWNASRRHPRLDKTKSVVQDLANRASEAGKQAMDRAGEFIEGVAPQAKQVASNLYDQGSRSREYVRPYAAQEPLAKRACGALTRGRRPRPVSGITKPRAGEGPIKNEVSRSGFR
jgi:hypothetical protein